MPRTKRADEAGRIYHALNRGNDRRELFHKPEDYLAFLRTLQQGLEKYPVDLLAYCLMPNHWHLVVRPREDGRMGKLLGWVSATHTLRYNAHHHQVGMGPALQEHQLLTRVNCQQIAPVSDEKLVMEKTAVLAHALEVTTLLAHRQNHGWQSVNNPKSVHNPSTQHSSKAPSSTNDRV